MKLMRLIDAEALKKAISNYYLLQSDQIEGVTALIDNAPTVEQPNFKAGYKQAILDGKTQYQRLYGEWLTPWEHEGRKYHTCSFCHITQRADTESRFCGYCGADMRGEEDGE